MDKYCPKCSAKCDERTGLCPHCDKAQLDAFNEILAESKMDREELEKIDVITETTTIPVEVIAREAAEAKAAEADEDVDYGFDQYVTPVASTADAEAAAPAAEEAVMSEPAPVSKEAPSEVKRNGILAVIASFLVIIVVVSAITVGVSKGWIGGKAKKAQLHAAYCAYLNKKFIPEYKMFDLSHPKVSTEGVVCATEVDLNNDNTSEFVIGYYEKNNDAIEFKLTCLEYNARSIIQGRKEESDGTEGVDLNGTVTAFSLPDYNSELVEEARAPEDTYVYTYKGKDQSYVVVEHLSYTEGSDYDFTFFTLDGGTFRALADIHVNDISNDGSVIVSSDRVPPGYVIDNKDFDPSSLDFWEHIESNYKEKTILFMQSGDETYKYDKYYSTPTEAVKVFADAFKMKKNEYVKRDENGDRLYSLIAPDKKDLLFSYAYYIKNQGKDNEEKVYDVKDATDYILLLDEDNKITYDNMVEKNKETDTEDTKPAEATEVDTRFGDVVSADNYIYYWKYNEDSFASSEAPAGLYDYRIAGENELIRRDKNGREKTILTTNGAGALAIANGRIYYQRVSSGYNNFTIYSCAPEGGSSDYVGEGRLVGTLQDGTYVVYASTGDPEEFASIFCVKGLSGDKMTVAYSARFLFCSGDRIYYQAEEESSSDARKGMTTLCSVNANGSANRAEFYTEPDLYDEVDYDSSKSFIINPYVYGGNVYYAYGSYKNDKTFNGGAIVKYRLDGSAGEVVGTTKTDTFTIDKDGNVFSSEDDKYVNGYTFTGGTAKRYDPASSKTVDIITPADYAEYSKLTLGAEGDEALSLKYLYELDNKRYFMLCEGRYQNDEDGVRQYAYKSSALFVKDIKSGKTTMLYKTDEKEKSVTEDDDDGSSSYDSEDGEE